MVSLIMQNNTCSCMAWAVLNLLIVFIILRFNVITPLYQYYLVFVTPYYKKKSEKLISDFQFTTNVK
ncbi:hypothetical protein LY08_01417 [Olleya aquimaris]|uniref:Uncharacterized protein n=1 Tax=Olleya aquimaris TaxID=639310 RepID=A0A327RFQ5_9FLAO|nr:hypothetical protein LY08_01417 [Olleya aquimaris]